jgi:sugar phosphate isomerase/epimerase
MPKFGASIYCVTRKITSKEWSPMEAITWLAEQGAEVIELVPFGIDFLGEPDMAIKCMDAAQRAGVTITNFSLNANFLQISDTEYEREAARAGEYIKVAARIGVAYMRVDCAGFRRPIETNTTAHFMREFPLIIETYERLCGMAAPYNIQILLENHGFHVNGSERTAQIFEHMRGKNFGGQLDVGNYACVDEAAEAAVKKCIDYATTIHMKDFYIRPANRDPGDASQFDCSNSWFRSVAGKYLRGAILGQGDLDIPAIVSDIKQSGFDGDIFIEYEGMEDCLYGTKVSLSNLKKIWEQA